MRGDRGSGVYMVVVEWLHVGLETDRQADIHCWLSERDLRRGEGEGEL